MRPAICVFLLVFTATLTAQPVVYEGGIVNNASYALPGLPNAAIARGSMCAIFGENLGPAAGATATAFPLPAADGLAGTSVQVTVAGISVDAIMAYTTAGQVGAILPSRTPVGVGTLTLTYEGQTSEPVSISVVESSFGIFTRNQRGSGPAIVQNVNSETDRPVNSLADVARPGQTMILWGTGLGPVGGDEAAGPLPGNLDLPVEVIVGDVSANVVYKGRSGCCSGIDQIVFEVPAGVEGCYVPLIVKTGNVVSNFT
ncbi:MAG: hypothetical protein GY953_15125, partial [bacterium]|nr:hypothetical protein [bacterium]